MYVYVYLGDPRVGSRFWEASELLPGTAAPTPITPLRARPEEMSGAPGGRAGGGGGVRV